MYKHKRYNKNWRFDHKGSEISTHTDDEDEAKRFIKEYKFYAENPKVKSVNDALGGTSLLLNKPPCTSGP